MRRQAALSIRVALTFVAILVAIPLINLFQKDLVTKEFLGFPLSWLVLGVLFFPLTWALSGYFVKASTELDQEIIDQEKEL